MQISLFVVLNAFTVGHCSYCDLTTAYQITTLVGGWMGESTEREKKILCMLL